MNKLVKRGPDYLKMRKQLNKTGSCVKSGERILQIISNANQFAGRFIHTHA